MGMRGGYLPRPPLKFRNGTAPTPRLGFQEGLKPLKGPTRAEITLVKPAPGELRKLVESLVHGASWYGGLEDWFQLQVDVEEAEASELEDTDIAIAAVPDEELVEYELDPYLPLKRQLSQKGIPSQMIAYSTLNQAQNPYILFNLALSVYAKCGGVPWTVDKPPISHLTVGVDTAYRGQQTAAASLWIADWGQSLSWNLHPAQRERVNLAEAVEQACREAAEKTARRPKVIHVHRDGLVHPQEADQAAKAIQQLAHQGIVHPEPEYTILSVRKASPPRIFSRTPRGLRAADKGAFIELTSTLGVVMTTGHPEIPSTLPPPKPLVVEVADTNNWEKPLQQHLQEVYWLSELHWASGLRSAKLPITTLYPHRIAKFTAAGVKPHKNLRTKLWFL